MRIINDLSCGFCLYTLMNDLSRREMGTIHIETSLSTPNRWWMRPTTVIPLKSEEAVEFHEQHTFIPYIDNSIITSALYLRTVRRSPA